jgi:two-component system sensor histidine kinase KdpD
MAAQRGGAGAQRSCKETRQTAATAYAWAMNERDGGRTAAPRGTRWLGYAVAVGGTAVAAVALVAVREGVSKTSVVLAFLCVVFAAAAAGGLGPGLVASALGFLAFDILFLPPFGRLIVHDPQDFVSLAAFLGVAVAVSALVGLIRQRRAEAEQREHQARVLYELSSSLAAGGSLPDTLRGVTRTVRELFDLAGCAIVLREGDEARIVAADGDQAGLAAAIGAGPDGRMAAGTLVRVRGPEAGTLTPGQALAVPMQRGQGPGGAVGALVVLAGRGNGGLGFGEAERRVLATFANQAALAVEQRQAEQERGRARTLEETDRLRSALLNSVSHDLRTPLATITGAVTRLLDGQVGWSDEQRAEFLRMIDGETDRLSHLVHNLLDMSRLEAGDYRPDVVEVRLDEIVGPVVDRARAAGRQRVDLDLPAELPEVMADPVRLDQVVTNLLDNARRYAPGSPVEVTALAHGDTVELRVVDHGPGIPAPERQRIFERFYRLKGGGRRPEGTGMGLAICRGIVEALDGRLEVETTAGGGATFIVRLPAAPASVTT